MLRVACFLSCRIILFLAFYSWKLILQFSSVSECIFSLVPCLSPFTQLTLSLIILPPLQTCTLSLIRHCDRWVKFLLPVKLYLRQNKSLSLLSLPCYMSITAMLLKTMMCKLHWKLKYFWKNKNREMKFNL